MAAVYKPDNVVLVTGDDSGVSKDDFELAQESEGKEIDFPKNIQVWDTIYVDRSES